MGDVTAYIVMGLVVAVYFGWMYLSTRPFKAGTDMSFNAIEARKDAEAARLAGALQPIVERAVEAAVRKAFENRRTVTMTSSCRSNSSHSTSDLIAVIRSKS
jgi:hypothetical protein